MTRILTSVKRQSYFNHFLFLLIRWGAKISQILRSNHLPGHWLCSCLETNKCTHICDVPPPSLLYFGKWFVFLLQCFRSFNNSYYVSDKLSMLSFFFFLNMIACSHYLFTFLLVRNGDSHLFDKVRGYDIKLLRYLSVRYICDLMVENKKVKFGLK